MIDIKAVKEEALREFSKESGDKAKNALKAQMRVVDNAQRILRVEQMKLADIESQIAEGTL